MFKLKRCPFCGGEAELRDTGTVHSYYWIYCKDCGCKQPCSIHLESVINTWNTRKPIERILERLEEESNNSINDFDRTRDYYHDGKADGFERAIRIVREEGGVVTE